MQNEDNLKGLTEKFFKSLKCEVIWKGKILFIEKVPADFEKLFGKKSPYSFVFDTADLNDETELITKGSSLIKLIANYLDHKAQTTLLKIKFNPDFKTELKKNINWNDYEIVSISEKENNDYIYRFTIMTIFQYLNEKEQIISTIYIHNKSILDNFNADNYETGEGKKEEISFDNANIRENYAIAKDKLKYLLQKRTEHISQLLNKSLEKEIQRIDSHYKSEYGEIDTEVGDAIKKIQELNLKLKRASAKNRPIIEEKMERLNQTIEKLNKSEEKEKFEREKSFLINDEKQKHSINISNNLINTSIIYYPIYSLKASIKKKDNLSGFSKEIRLDYNPLTKRLSQLLCEGCKKEINEVNLCSTNHLACTQCISKCPSCFKIVCNSCKKSSCTVCGISMCQKCETICFKCLKPVCKSHSCKDSINGKNLCNNCAEYCPICQRFSQKTNFKKCQSCSSNFCVYCTKSKIVNSKTKILCKYCLDKYY
ncbi:Uncharacterised protein [uncultured archaeon]|nr:Uncharacterised protein [uncultured archaeon]